MFALRRQERVRLRLTKHHSDGAPSVVSNEKDAEGDACSTRPILRRTNAWRVVDDHTQAATEKRRNTLVARLSSGINRLVYACLRRTESKDSQAEPLPPHSSQIDSSRLPLPRVPQLDAQPQETTFRVLRKRPLDLIFHALHKRRELRKQHIDQPLGRMAVTITKVHGLKAIRPYLEVSVEGSEDRSQPFDAVHGLPRPVTYWFDFTDIMSDIYVFVMEDYSVVHSHQCVGHVIIPLLQCFSFDAPVPVWKETFQLFPVHPVEVRSKYRSGVPRAPNSAMHSSGKHLGYISIAVRFEPQPWESPVWVSYFRPFVNNPTTQHPDKDVPEVTVTTMKQNFYRLKRGLRLPLLLQLVFTFPGSISLPFLSFYIFIQSRAWQWPILFFLSIVVNGELVRQTRDFDHVILWDDEVVRSNDGPIQKWRSLKRLMGSIQRWATIIGIILLAVLLFPLSACLALVPAGWFAFFSSLPLCAFCILKSWITGKCSLQSEPPVPNDGPPSSDSSSNITVDQGPYNEAEDDGAADKPPDSESVPPEDGLIQALKYFIQRVPDALELEHRWIAEVARNAGSQLESAEIKATARRN